ncbi:hypothetical protein ACUCJX_000292 [Yersinia enterocolitica]
MAVIALPGHCPTLSATDSIAGAAVSRMGIAFLPTWLVGDEIAKGKLRIAPRHDAPVTALWPFLEISRPGSEGGHKLHAALSKETNWLQL